MFHLFAGFINYGLVYFALVDFKCFIILIIGICFLLECYEGFQWFILFFVIFGADFAIVLLVKRLGFQIVIVAFLD